VLENTHLIAKLLANGFKNDINDVFAGFQTGILRFFILFLLVTVVHKLQFSFV